MNGIDIIRSTLLNTGDVVFGMSTRRGGVSPPPLDLNLSFSVGDDPSNVEKNRAIFFNALSVPPDRVAFPMQVHSSTVERVDGPGRVQSCDALVTNTRDVYLCISAADCVPVFLYDPAHHAIAGIHAGWRGTEGRIVENAITHMKAEFATDPRDLIAFIGPAAGQCCYAVGSDVAGRFDPKFRQERNGSISIDLKAANKEQLKKAGVPETSIEVSPLCTISETDFLHSYRRDGPNSGRMLAVLGLRR